MTISVKRWIRTGKPKMCATEGCKREAVPNRKYCITCINKRDKARLQSQARKEKLAVRQAKAKADKQAKREVSDKVLHESWREVVARRAGNKCEVCGVQRPHKANGELAHLDPHHIYSKRNAWGRFDPDNGVYLCASCHAFGRESAHGAGAWFTDWLRKRRGQEFLDELARRHAAYCKLDRQAVKIKLQEELLRYAL